MRNMSFSMTTQQVRDGTKTVTRRLGWEFLEPGDLVMACVKCMGLRKGEKVERIRPIRVVDVRRERLGRMEHDPDYGRRDAALEGYPGMTGEEFVTKFCGARSCRSDETVTRIEFEYVDGEDV